MKKVFLTLSVLFFWTLAAMAQVDSTKLVVIQETLFEGNDKTKEFILERELTYKNGDTISLLDLSSTLIRSRENIFNTRLFNRVEYSILQTGDEVRVSFQLEERWYIWPYPVLENADRNFNTWWQTKDFSRLTYGMFLNWNNFRGRNETFQVMGKVGFENQFSLGYNIPNLNKAKTLGMYVATGYAEYREVNYASVGNKRIFYKNEDGPGRQVLFGRVSFTYRKGLNARHRMELSYHQIRVDSAVTLLSEDYLKNNQTRSDFFTLRYYGKYDTRDYIDYPLKGYKVEMYLSKYGLGILENENLNLVTARAGFNWHLPLSEKWYFANSVVGKMSFFDDPPYMLQEGLGYSNTIRGYELYVMDAQNYGIVKSNLKFALVKRKDLHLKWLKVPKFNKPYFSLFLSTYFDFGYADDKLYGDVNPLSNRWAYGYGVGIDFLTYYDFVMRIEYSINAENEKGVFLHFKKAI